MSSPDPLGPVATKGPDLPFRAHEAHLARLAGQSRLRQLAPRSGRDFSSNDYLGLAASGVLAEAVREALDRGVPVGSGGSRLLRGNHAEHEQLEAEAAGFLGCESTLFFSSGYAANSALYATLPQRGDLVIADDLVHASIHEGLKLTRAQHVFARHNCADHVDSLARDWRRRGGLGVIWIAVESLYSMDGDRAPLGALAAIAEAHGGVLCIDEAHAVGIYGGKGRGLSSHLQGRGNIVSLATCGKALGCEGALLAMPRVLRDFLLNRGRGFIFSTAPSPLMAAVVRAALREVERGTARRQRLKAQVALAGRLVAQMGLPASGSQIQPVVLGNDARTMAAACGLQQAGFDVRGIRPPTVPNGTSRLRLSITLNVSEADIEALFGAVAHAIASQGHLA